MNVLKLTGSSASDPTIPTTPILDGSIRTGFLALVQAILGCLTAFGLDLSAEQVAAILTVTGAAIVFSYGVFDKVVAPRLAQRSTPLSGPGEPEPSTGAVSEVSPAEPSRPEPDSGGSTISGSSSQTTP